MEIIARYSHEWLGGQYFLTICEPHWMIGDGTFPYHKLYFDLKTLENEFKIIFCEFFFYVYSDPDN